MYTHNLIGFPCCFHVTPSMGRLLPKPENVPSPPCEDAPSDDRDRRKNCLRGDGPEIEALGQRLRVRRCWHRGGFLCLSQPCQESKPKGASHNYRDRRYDSVHSEPDPFRHPYPTIQFHWPTVTARSSLTHPGPCHQTRSTHPRPSRPCGQLFPSSGH